MRWRLIIKEFGPELKYIKGENSVLANALYRLDMTTNRDIINISEIYVYDDNNLPDISYPIRYHDIDKSHKTDDILKLKLVSHKDYTLDNFFGGYQNHHLVFQNIKICLPTSIQKKNLYLYNEMLCHPGETLTEHTLRQHFYWKGLCTIFHNMCKKCPTCQRAKTTNQKYGKLPPKQDETNAWDTLCVDLIGPYTIHRQGKNLLKIWCLTMIDPATGWFEMAQIPNKPAAEIAEIAKKT